MSETKKNNWKTMDGNTAAAHVAYAFSDVSAIYPITPSSPMGEMADAWSAQGRKNIFNQTVKVSQLQSEAGAAGAIHGSLSAGAFTTTFTASQGLLLMVPNMYKIAGELMPTVFHISARSIAAEVLSIFGDHQDAMAVRPTGFAELASASIQEIMDLALVSHLSTLRSSIPFLHFFEGFRSSHEVQKIQSIDYEDMARLADWNAIKNHRNRALNPNHPHIRLGAMGPDTYFQIRERGNEYYEKVPRIVQEEMDKVASLTGRQYHLFDYFGDQNAERVIIMMGAGAKTTEETVEHLTKQGEKVGVVIVRLFRPFSADEFYNVIPKTAKKIAVLDRTKEPGAFGEPLYLDVCSVFQQKGDTRIIVGGRYGLSSKQFTPTMAKAVFDNLKKETPKNNFTVGITDDTTHTSLPPSEVIDTAPSSMVRCKFWGIGGDGTVGANKNAIKIIGDNTSKFAQGYFEYDAKKSGGVTRSHLRFGDEPIKARYLINDAEYIACHNYSYVDKYDLLEGIKKDGTFVLNSPWSFEEMNEKFPASLKQAIARNNLKFYNIDAVAIAKETGLGQRINMVMQTVFFKLSNILPLDESVRLLKEAIKKTYGVKGEDIVEMNYKAVDLALERIERITYPESWKTAQDSMSSKESCDRPEFVKNIVDTMSSMKGDSLKTSDFEPSGFFPLETSKYEKRSIAIEVPEWQIDNCIQCNMCSLICPHAAIRPFLLTVEELNQAPERLHTKKAIGKDAKDFNFRIQVYTEDCAGCGNCVDICPSKEKALIMKPISSQTDQIPLQQYIDTIPERNGGFDKYSLKGSQFKKPLLEFSGACTGCGETPYVKLLTQLFGSRMIIANATGCSSIWGGYAPSVPWAKDKHGRGPAWANSLFEDNAEYGFGMQLATNQRRELLKQNVVQALNEDHVSDELKSLFQQWIEHFYHGDETDELSLKIQNIMQNMEKEGVLAKIWEERDMFLKPSHWVIGGDGWAYDIGFGGLDHVLASGADINVLVLDTEVYSNTGGQASKATPLGSVAQFAYSGKKTKKKDLGLMMMNYGYVYVASIAMGANMTHALKVMKEAESYPGPSLIIAYAPCINHGIKAGMGKTQYEEKLAVDVGYWLLYRFDPRLKDQNKNPFQLDSKEPSGSFHDFIMGEIRYNSLTRTFPEEAKRLHAQLETDMKERYQQYKRMAER